MANRKITKTSLNYLPSIIGKSNNQDIKLLIDTGAIKNVVKPGIINKTKTVSNTKVNNIIGCVNQKGKIKLFGNNFPTQNV